MPTDLPRVRNLHSGAASKGIMSMLMDGSPPTLARFVRAVHRRQFVVRVLERAGLGLLGGCVVAVGLVGVMLWRGEDAWGVAGIVLAIGAVAGAFWGLADRPTALAAAAEADRQLDLADLLATAWALRADASDARDADPFRDAVMALAAARCRALSPSTVLLRRLGARAWGGIALAVAFVATLAALSDRSPRASAADSRPAPPGLEAARDTARRPILEITVGDARMPRRVEQNPADDRPLGNDTPDVSPDQSLDGPDDPRPPQSSQRTSSASSPGTGATEARTRTPDPSRKRPPHTPDANTPPDASPPDAREAAGGAGRAAEDPVSAQVTGGGTLAGKLPARRDPPWAGADWPTAVHSAREAVRSGRVPDDYRDLVRGYFDASTPPPADTRQK